MQSLDRSCWREMNRQTIFHTRTTFALLDRSLHLVLSCIELKILANPASLHLPYLLPTKWAIFYCWPRVMFLKEKVDSETNKVQKASKYDNIRSWKKLQYKTLFRFLPKPLDFHLHSAKIISELFITALKFNCVIVWIFHLKFTLTYSLILRILPLTRKL